MYEEASWSSWSGMQGCCEPPQAGQNVVGPVLHKTKEPAPGTPGSPPRSVFWGIWPIFPEAFPGLMPSWRAPFASFSRFNTLMLGFPLPRHRFLDRRRTASARRRAFDRPPRICRRPGSEGGGPLCSLEPRAQNLAK